MVAANDDNMRAFLFEYEYDGETWGFEIIARSRAEALSRLIALGNASLKGEVSERIALP